MYQGCKRDESGVAGWIGAGLTQALLGVELGGAGRRLWLTCPFISNDKGTIINRTVRESGAAVASSQRIFSLIGVAS